MYDRFGVLNPGELARELLYLITTLKLKYWGI